MESDLFVKEKKRGNLVGNNLSGMVVTVVHKGSDALAVRVGKAELCGAYSVGLKADAEYLGLKGNVNLGLVVIYCKDLVKRLLESCAGSKSVGGDILVSVGDPDIHNTGHTGLGCHVLSDLKTSLTVSYPVSSGLLVGRRKGEVILYHRMCKEGGVEVKSHTVRLCELYPLSEVLRTDSVSTGVVTLLEESVASVKIKLLCAGNERDCLLKVSHKLCGSGSLAGIVTGGLDTAGESLSAVKTGYVVALPAMDSNGNVLKNLNSLVSVNAVLSVRRLCVFVVCHNYLLLLI